MNEAGELLSGNGSPVPTLASLVRRLERKFRKPHLLEPVCKAIDEALNSLALAQDGIDHAMREIDFDPRVLEQVEERLCSQSRCAQIFCCGRRPACTA